MAITDLKFVETAFLEDGLSSIATSIRAGAGDRLPWL